MKKILYVALLSVFSLVVWGFIIATTSTDNILNVIAPIFIIIIAIASFIGWTACEVLNEKLTWRHTDKIVERKLKRQEIIKKIRAREYKEM